MRELKNAIFALLLCFVMAACSQGDGQNDARTAIDSIADKAMAMTDSVLNDTREKSQGVQDIVVAEESAETEAVDEADEADTTVYLTPQQADSLMFRLKHHYTQNFNFIVKADSLVLVPREGDLLTDTCVVYDDDVIVVASIKTVPNDTIDSIWVKVAHDQFTMGWIPEHELLRGAVPDDSISELLYTLTGSRGFWMSALVFLGVIGFLLRRGKVKKLQILRFDEMDSFYPVLLLTMIAVMASLYASVQNFVPEYWQEYYYHPTLNPLQLPFLMAMLVVLFWLIIIIYIAVVDEVYHNFYFVPGMAYLFELTGLAMVVYLVISWSTLIYVGYLLTPLLIAALWYVYCHMRTVFVQN